MERDFWPAGKPAAISFSFDDARLSQVDRGLEILARRDVHATFYVSLPELERRLTGWQQAVRAGHEIGNHSLTHPCSGNYPFARHNPLEEMTLEDMRRELDEASGRIDQLLGVRPVTFAYPCGNAFVGRGRGTQSYVPLVAERFLAGRGYLNGQTNDPWRCDLSQLVSVGLDRAPSSYARNLIEIALDEGSWLVCTAHDIGDGHDGLSVDVAALEAALSLASERGLWIGTVAEVARHVTEKRG
ncbi:MAG TPA: polysaccharide deacetylase family protein [Spirochaetia bacterium]|nr:polysaccharide deacetylase family protein [Spirochaetia bacterium]